MNPEELLNAVSEKLEQGADIKDVNAALFEATKGRIMTVDQLRSALPRQEPAAPTPGALATGVLSAADMALFGLGDELVGLVRGEEAAEDFRATRQRGQEAHPIANIAGGAAGLLTPGGAPSLAGRAAIRAVPAAGRAAAGLLGRGAARAGGREVAQTLARGTGQVVGRAGAGVGVGAAEGGLLGATLADPGERAEGAVGGGVVGAVTGGLLSGLSTLGGLRRGLKASEGGSQRLAEGVEAGAQIPGRSAVRRQVEAARREAREAFQRAEGSGPVAGAADVIRQNPAARETLERIGTAESRKLASQIQKFEKGEGELPEIGFGIVDEIRKSLGREASAFSRRVPGARGAIPSQSQVREAEAAVGQLESILADVPGFQQGIQASARGGALGRALEDGERLFTRPIADVERLFEGNPLTIGNRRIQPPAGANELAALRRGMADKLLTRLNKGDQSVPSFVKSLESGTDLRRRMRLILGSDEALEGFLAEARQESANLTTANIARLVAKYGSFALLGSSILGGGVELL